MLAQEVVIDPFLLCLPSPCESLDQLEEFISALVGWRGLLNRSDVCVLLSDSVRVALNDDDEFPHRHRLAKLIDQFECTFADANTVSKVANSILERSPALENYFGIDAILDEEASFAITPPLILSRLKSRCRIAFREDLLIASIKIDERFSRGFESGVMIASGSWREDSVPSDITVKAVIEDVGLVPTNAITADVPFSIIQSIPVAFSHDQLLESLDLWSIWDRASSNDAVCLSIEACIRTRISSGVCGDNACKFSIGNDFVQSLHACGADARHDYAMVTIESCARIVLDIPKNPVKEFRLSADATAKQRSRKEDGALAFRTHLTKKGVGLRLMFWQRTNGTIEFANIGAKGKLEIS